MTFVAEHHDLGVERILRLLEVAPSTFYGWRAAAASGVGSDREEMDKALLTAIADIRETRRGDTYGSPRVHQTLARNGIRVSRKRVERTDALAGLAGRSRA